MTEAHIWGPGPEPRNGRRSPEELLNEMAKQAIDPAYAEDLRARAKRLAGVKPGSKDAFRRTFEEAYSAALGMMARSTMWKRREGKEQQFTAEACSAALARDAGPWPDAKPEWWPS